MNKKGYNQYKKKDHTWTIAIMVALLLLAILVGLWHGEELLAKVDDKTNQMDKAIKVVVDDRTDIQKLTDEVSTAWTEMKKQDTKYEDDVKRAEAIIKKATESKNAKVEAYNQAIWNLETYTN